jgi:hypothetical protein
MDEKPTQFIIVRHKASGKLSHYPVKLLELLPDTHELLEPEKIFDNEDEAISWVLTENEKLEEGEPERAKPKKDKPTSQPQ